LLFFSHSGPDHFHDVGHLVISRFNCLAAASDSRIDLSGFRMSSEGPSPLASPANRLHHEFEVVARISFDLGQGGCPGRSKAYPGALRARTVIEGFTVRLALHWDGGQRNATGCDGVEL